MLQSLPPALAALGAYNQFCIYKTIPDPKKFGKRIKLPCDHTGRVRNAHDPSVWMPAENALAWAKYYGSEWGVAFVLSDHDPFFFIDIDSCLMPDNTWSPIAQQLLQAFQGCAVEVSNSGTGLHIIGTGRIAGHGCKNKDHNLEFYTRKRFIALTGNQALGDAATPSAHLPWLVDSYFPNKFENAAMGDDWTNGPCVEWRGPNDDEELLRRALRSVSAQGVFSGRATFQDLWTATEDVLARNYPPDAASSLPWDGSGVDEALATHLAFWTGRDCERIRRLMLQSALVREKWQREDYIERTIVRACQFCKKVLQDEPLAVHDTLAGVAPTATDLAQTELAQAEQPADDSAAVVSREARLVEGSTIVSPEQQLELFKGCVYIRSLDRVLVPSGELLGQSAFKVLFGGYRYVMDRTNNGLTSNAWEAFTQSRAVRHVQAATTCFRPKAPAGAILFEGGQDMANTYVPIAVPMQAGDPSKFLGHLAKLLPTQSDRDSLLAYLAACVQHKGKKFAWAPVIQGVEGNAKTALSICVAYAIGGRYVHWPRAAQLSNKFNGWMYGKLLYCVEDIFTPKNRAEVMEELKPMITGQNLEIEGKGSDQIVREVCGNFIFNCNNKAALRKTRNDRRFAMYFTAQQHVDDLTRDGISIAYVIDLYDWLNGAGGYARFGANYGFKVVAHFLSTYSIPDHLNPATGCPRAPQTSSTEEAIQESLGIPEQITQEKVEEGERGFRFPWISSRYLGDLLAQRGHRMGPRLLPSVVKNLGYVPHPALPGGRAPKDVNPDAARPILYVHPDSQEFRITTPQDVAKAYEAAQLA